MKISKPCAADRENFQPAGPISRTRMLPSLNGWRGVSILLVLGSHLTMVWGWPWRRNDLFIKFCDGDLGVRIFFTISGFLITWLMVTEEQKSGAISLKHFYIRRSLRILPVYVTCLIVLAIIQTFGVGIQAEDTWLKLLTFTRNFYAGNHAAPLISAHFWSLSVEEQFYLVWPLVFLALGYSFRRRIGFLLGIILLSVGWKILALFGYYDRHVAFAFGDHSTFLYLDCIAYGCVGAMLTGARHGSLKWLTERLPLPVLLLACFFIIGPEISGLGKGLQNFGFLLLLLQSVLLPNFAPFRFLNHPWLVKIGALSYSLYIWQQLVFLLWPFPKLWFLSLAATFAPFWISYVFLEKTFFALRARYRA